MVITVGIDNYRWVGSLPRRCSTKLARLDYWSEIDGKFYVSTEEQRKAVPEGVLAVVDLAFDAIRAGGREYTLTA